MGDRERLGAMFDAAASTYQQARPSYPERLFDAVVACTGLRPHDRVVEVGCATGTATLPLARRGLRLTCLEPGPALAATARANLAGFPGVEVVESTFEDLDPTTVEPADAVIAATSWHWLDPAVRYRRAWEVLRPRGHLAFWRASHVFPDGGDPFFDEIQEVYDEIGEGLPDGATWPRPGDLPEERGDIEASGLFDVLLVQHLDWEVAYDAESYLALLGTFSGHLTMKAWQRRRLASEVRRRLAVRPDGLVRRRWGTVLHVARRRDARC